MELVIHVLTHWGRVTHTCVTKQTIIGSDNGLSPGRRQAIIWTNAGTWLIQILGTNFNEILSEIQTFSLKKMHFKMSSGKWRPFCLSLNVLTQILVYLISVSESCRCLLSIGKWVITKIVFTARQATKIKNMGFLDIIKIVLSTQHILYQ